MTVNQGNLWIARAIFDLGGVQFGSFNAGETAVNSPVFVNPRVMFTQPVLLRRIAEIIAAEVAAGQARRRPRYSRFSLVAGVPFGGLQLATAYALQADISLVLVHPVRPGHDGSAIEGQFVDDDHVLILDDLMTGGGSIVRTIDLLTEFNLRVHDVIVLIDREQGGVDRLSRRGVQVTSLLTLRQLVTYGYESGLVPRADYARTMEYLEPGHRRTPDAPSA